jgi:hypothetical protein
MSKRKSNNSRKPDAATPNFRRSAATTKNTVPAAKVKSSEGEELQAAPQTQTRLLELPGQEAELKLPPVIPSELKSKAVLAEPNTDFVLSPQVEATDTATLEHRTCAPLPNMDGPKRAIAGIEACQTLFIDMTRNNVDFAASLAVMRSPLEFIDIATTFVTRRTKMYERFSEAIADIAAGRKSRNT